MAKLCLGYAPIGAPSSNPIYPFHNIFDLNINLGKADSLKGVDAIVLWGGEDISPSLYNELPCVNSGPREPTMRDLFETHLLREAKEAGIPIIGVCRGAQLACAFAGGSLIQHVNKHNDGNHIIKTFDNLVIETTSAHHQMMYPYDVTHELLAWCETPRSKVYQPETTKHSAAYDKKLVFEPEVVYFNELNAMVCQGHPEWMKESSQFVQWFLEQILFFQFNKVSA